MVAWGDLDAVTARIREHVEAGADHVAVRVLVENPRRGPGEILDEVAAALREL